MSAVFIVMANVEHEGNEPVRGYLTLAEAAAFAGFCNAHQKHRPAYTDQCYDSWLEAHPASQYSYCDDFSVESIPLGAPA